MEKRTGNNDRVIKSSGRYNMNFIDWNNEWERVAEVEMMMDRGEEPEDKEEAERIRQHREIEREKFGVKPNIFPIIKADNVIAKKECYICLKNFIRNTNIIKLPCRHMFCETCINPWLKHNSFCPTCKYKLKEDEVDNNY
jgi:hypothetical protein